VELGLSSQDYTVVLSGVNADDLILTTWTSELEEGTKVTLYSEETSAADSQAQ
jgi:hypothetical protein